MSDKKDDKPCPAPKTQNEGTAATRQSPLREGVENFSEQAIERKRYDVKSTLPEPDVDPDD
ncbi:hypothetical protein TH15_17965 [Thalassospira profundimaris]|uniref:Uncharacterized protein n=1 Tax=Thalassospira indica TaxID=1891279 RepID=A0ABM6XXH9_9PROT|nr:hypothetical protein DY252_09380 [Thalassospira indica]OAZ11358.1 hypothetical protein TH15_17965 [Thalassospira profundimaris]